MAFDIHRRSSDILQKGQVGFNGLVVPDNRNIERTFTLVSGQQSQVTEITITARATADTDTLGFTISRAIDSSSAAFSVTFSGAITVNETAQEVVDAFNADASFTKMAFASRDGAKVVLTAIFPGADYAFSVGTIAVNGNVTADPADTTTTAADSTDALFCDVLMAGPAIASNYLDVAADFGHDSERIGEMIAGKFGAAVTVAGDKKVLTITGNENAKTIRISIAIEHSAPEVFDVTSSSTATLTGDAIEAALADSLLCEADNVAGVVTLTATTVGPELYVTVLPLDTTMTVPVTDGAGAILGGLQESMVGIVVYDPTDADTDALGSNSTGVKAGTEGRMLEEGYFLMKPTDSASFDAVFNKPVYVGQNGAEKGRIFLTAGAPADNRVKWVRCIVKQAVRGGFYVLRLLPLGTH